jgi:hypothetical protein
MRVLERADLDKDNTMNMVRVCRICAYVCHLSPSASLSSLSSLSLLSLFSLNHIIMQIEGAVVGWFGEENKIKLKIK